MWNLPFPTFGGKQLWADELIYADWRIQRNIMTGHWRLLDPYDVRKAWGSRADCEEKLQGLREAGRIRVPGTDVVILLHGLMRAKESLQRMERALEASGFEVYNANYPSYFGEIELHAAQLDRLIQAMPEARRISFVVHSTGGIVIRSWMLEHDDPRVQRAVMLGVPNSGSGAADLLDRFKVLRLFFGPAALQMRTPEHGGITESYGRPRMDVAVMAGGRGNKRGFNWLLKGDNDLVVEVENAKLPGSKAFMLVPYSHTFIMDKPQVIDAVRRFLITGRL